MKTRAVAVWLLLGSLLIGDTFDYHSVRGRQPKGNLSGLLEGETHFSRQGKSRVQRMAGYGKTWSGGHHLLWDGLVGDSMRTTFRVEQKGRYRVTMRLTKAPDYGVFRVDLDGRKVLDAVDLYDPRVVLDKPLDLGELVLDAGEHKLVFTLTGANPKAVKFRGKGYLMGLDYMRLTRLDPPKPKPMDKPMSTEVATLREMRPVLEMYCVRCHKGDKPRGKVGIDKLTTKKVFLDDIATTRKILRALEQGEMPPEKAKPLPVAERRRLVGLTRSYLDEYLQANSELATTIMRRLNRYEYNNAVRDLLKLKGDIYPLPEKIIRADRPYFDPASGRFPDAVQLGNRPLGKNQVEKQILTGVVPFSIDRQAEFGFDNRGDERSVSPILLESFLQLGQAIVNSPEFDGYCGITNSFFRPPAGVAPEKLVAVAEERLKPFLARAFRGPVSEKTQRRYSRFFEREFARTGDFAKSMKAVVAGVLASPRFLYLIEKKHGMTEEEPLTDHELATRLSFFLWSSIPDEELLGLADRGRLRDRAVLSKQIDRMLEHPRSQALSQNFARQWLRLDRLITAVPDFDRFQVYYSRIGCEQFKFGLQTMIEPLLLFESIMVEDRSVMLLVDSNYSYRTDELQSWYKDKVPFRNRQNRNRFGTFQQAFRKRSLDTRREGGVITSSAVLTMTSSPLRTSPINRGAWVAEVVFNQPPPPPPDVVPAIEADDAVIEAKGLTLRQRLKQHQVNQACVACHSKIDPLGFALENFDAIGRWRDKYRSGLPIDASGTLFGKEKFRDVVGLKDAILKHPEWFIRGFGEHLLSYALGRELELSDKPAVDRIVRRGLEENGRFTTIVREVALSYPFRNKTSQREKEPRK